MVLPSLHWLEALERGEVSWPNSSSEDEDPNLGEAEGWSPSSGTLSAMSGTPGENTHGGQSRQVMGLQEGRVVKRKGGKSQDGESSRGWGWGRRSGGSKVGGEVREGEVGGSSREIEDGKEEVERTPFEIVERRYACAVGLEKWERGAMMVMAGGERESLARARLRLLKTLAGLPTDAPPHQDSTGEDMHYYDPDSTTGDSDGEEQTSTAQQGERLRDAAVSPSS